MGQQLTVLEEDRQRAHYFALGALHTYRQEAHPSWETVYTLATGFSLFYTRGGNMGKGLDGAWESYSEALEAAWMRADPPPPSSEPADR